MYAVIDRPVMTRVVARKSRVQVRKSAIMNMADSDSEYDFIGDIKDYTTDLRAKLTANHLSKGLNPIVWIGSSQDHLDRLDSMIQNDADYRA